MYEFVDEEGRKHTHETSVSGRPFDFKKPMTCMSCIDMLWILRESLMEKYGWKTWPDDLMGEYRR